MRSHVRLFLLGAAFAGAAWPAAGQDLAAIDRRVESELAKQKVRGLALAIIKTGEPIVARGYGLANVEHGVPVTRQTIFQSGSVGRPFTAVAAMLLVEDGRLALGDPLTKLLPHAPSRWVGET